MRERRVALTVYFYRNQPIPATSLQKERLHQYLAQSPVLQALYFAKQQLNGFLLLKAMKAKRAKQLLPKFLALIRPGFECRICHWRIWIGWVNRGLRP